MKTYKKKQASNDFLFVAVPCEICQPTFKTLINYHHVSKVKLAEVHYSSSCLCKPKSPAKSNFPDLVHSFIGYKTSIINFPISYTASSKSPPSSWKNIYIFLLTTLCPTAQKKILTNKSSSSSNNAIVYSCTPLPFLMRLTSRPWSKLSTLQFQHVFLTKIYNLSLSPLILFIFHLSPAQCTGIFLGYHFLHDDLIMN